MQEQGELVTSRKITRVLQSMPMAPPLLPALFLTATDIVMSS